MDPEGWGEPGSERPFLVLPTPAGDLPLEPTAAVASAVWVGHHPVRLLSQKHPKLEPLDSTNESFVSLRSSGSGDSGQESVKTRLRSAAASSSSTRSLASLPSQESLVRLAASSPDGTSGHATLKSLPGYRPATRSSLRHSQGGGANTGESGGHGVWALPCEGWRGEP